MNQPLNTISQVESSKLIACLAVFRELYDNKQDLYSVIAMFIQNLIDSEGKYEFGLTEMTGLLNNIYGFQLPEAVVKKSLKKVNGVTLSSGQYAVQRGNSAHSDNFSSEIELARQEYAEILSELTKYISNHEQRTLSDSEKQGVIASFGNFILDSTYEDEYSMLIGAFIVKRASDFDFVGKLNRAKEGVIIYTGIQYDGAESTGHWRSKLTVIVDTEILFCLAGYNGSVHKKLWREFYELVREINNGKKTPIKLIYCSDVKDEIENFFNLAEQIVKGNVMLDPTRPAMVSIVDGCSRPSDVLAKKAQFFTLLNHAYIAEDDKDDYYEEHNHQYNLPITAISEEYSIDPLAPNNGLELMNKTSIRNLGSARRNFGEAHCIYITGKISILRAAKSLADETKSIPLAVPLDFMTNKFWFKLTKGFGGGSTTTFDAVARARILVSKLMNSSARNIYEELMEKFKSGEITEEKARNLVMAIKGKSISPDNVSQENIRDGIEFARIGGADQYIKQSEQDQIDKRDAEAMSVDLCKKLLANYESELHKIQETEKSVNEAICKRKTICKRLVVLICFLLACLVLFDPTDGQLFREISLVSWGILSGLFLVAFYALTGEKFQLKKLHAWLEKTFVNRKKIETKHSFSPSALAAVKKKIAKTKKQLKELEGKMRK